MDRRAFLAALGTLGTVGCVAQENSTPSTAEPTADTTSTTDTETAWPMPSYDAGLSNYTSETAGPTARVAEEWTVSVDASLSGPVVADGRVYVGGDDGVVRALDAGTGTERWRTSVGASAETPWLLDGRLFVPTTDSVVALDAEDGTTVWQVETPSRGGFLAATHGLYYIDTRGPTVVARDRTDGSRRWRAEIHRPWQLPLLATDDRVLVSTGTHWDEPWAFAADSGRFVGGVRPERGGSDMAATRLVLDGTVFAIDPMFGELQATSARGTVEWHYRIDAYGPVGLAGGADHLYVAAEHPRPKLYALSLADGETAWQTTLPDAHIGRPVVAEETVFVRSLDTLWCFDPGDGSERWSRSADGIGSQLALAGEFLYATDGGTLRALRAQ